MKKSVIRHSFSAAVIAVIVFVFATTAFAAWYFLSPSDVADRLESPALAEAFRSNDALLVNETKSQGGYDVTFLGIVSGKGLTALDSAVDTAKSYAVVAIAKQDGSMPDTSDEDFDNVPFFVSPLIKGQKPWLYNIASMNGGYSACVADGVMYRLIDCDSLEMFADRGLELIVSSTDFYSTEAYNYDEASGLVAPNPDFEGVNLVFDLPLDPTKGDFEKARQYLDTLWEDTGTNGAEAAFGQAAAADKSVELHDSDKGIGVSRVMTYEEYQAWVEQKLAETQELVSKGEYSAASLERDRSDYEDKLEKVKNGATLTMTEFEDGSYTVILTYPETGVPVTRNADGGIVLGNQP
ncbi:hypothetical protein SAMN02745823_00258 [Sporobacter termitidis DSM 10068]|uniref:Uncharacterized protein n=1 Tax=Sporobacter termitidis DSM 10068 TaxID=1123282 RepID=A0A1M5TWE1_9FIRM|nr:hypothetical protein SAMN02745823_00258 [Sporobacter termitidis DSM 10068]